METLTLVVLSGLTLGAMYALSAIGLSLIWGALGMLNMAHGSLLAIGGYSCYAIIVHLGLPPLMAIPLAIVAGGLAGLLLYGAIVKYMFHHPAFETNIIIATIGLAILSENIILKLFGAYPFRQPLAVEGGFRLGEILIPYQNLIIVAVSVMMAVAVATFLKLRFKHPLRLGDEMVHRQPTHDVRRKRHCLAKRRIAVARPDCTAPFRHTSVNEIR